MNWPIGRPSAARPHLTTIVWAASVVVGTLTACILLRDSGSTVQDAASVYTRGDLSGGRAALTVVLSGVLAAMVVEFAKRLTGLKSAFNRAQVVLWFSAELVEARYEQRRAARRSRVERSGGVEAPTGPNAQGIRLRASADALTVQLSATLRPVLIDAITPARKAPGRSDAPSGEERPDPRWTLEVIAGPQLWQVLEPTLEAATYGRSPDVDMRAAESMEVLDRWLDGFHLETSERWTRLTQALAALLAGIFAAFAATGSVAYPFAVGAGFALLGVVVGGPIAWLTSDLGRLIEGRRT
jgi:hypothetical protein